MRVTNNNPKTTIKLISNSTEFLKIEDLWNTLVNKSCTSPFLLSGFIKQWMDSTESNEWTSLLLMFSMNGTVTGFVPLAIKTKFGIRFAKFLPMFTYNPDFIVADQHRQIFIKHTLNFLLRELNCKFVDFSLQLNSPTLEILERHCTLENINFSVITEMGHSVIPTCLDWEHFKKIKGRNFRKQYNKMKRNFDYSGSWKIVCTEDNPPLETVKKIFKVESQSWKEKWRIQRLEEKDQSLQLVLEGAHHTAKKESGFVWKVFFLELDRNAVAYFLVFQYKETAFLVKTSYDERYKELSPGTFLKYAVLRQIFGTKNVQNIDFVTDLPYHRRWTTVSLPRVRAMLIDGTLPVIWKQIIDCQSLSKVNLLAKMGLLKFEQLGRSLAKTIV